MTVVNGRKSVTLADVAREAGVSKTTVSHALSGKGWVSSTTRETVLRLADEMSFQVDPLARLLSNGRSEKTIGFYTLDLDLSARTRQLQIIQAELSVRGYSVPIYAYGYNGRDELLNQMALMDNLLAQRPRAIVCNTSGVQKKIFKRLQQFADDGGILVCYGYIEFAPIACDQVMHVENEAFGLAARHLTQLGHRDIGVFNVGQRKPTDRSLESVTEALREVGADVRDEWLFCNDGTRRYEEDGAGLGHEFLALKERPSAMVIANDYAATAFISTVARGGVRVPQDVSVVGFDDDAIAPYGVVPLTTVSAPVEKVAGHVVELLLSRLENGFSDEPRFITVRGEMITRESTAAK